MTRLRRAVVLFVAAAGLTALVTPAARAGGDRVAMRFERVLAELDLSEEQRGRVQSLRSRFEADMSALAEALARKAADLRARIEETPGEQRTIEDLVQEIGRVQTEILRARVRAIRDLRDVLNPQQQARLRALEEKLRSVRGPAPGSPR